MGVKNKHDLYYLLGFGFLEFNQNNKVLTLKKDSRLKSNLESLSFRFFDRNIVESDRPGNVLSINDEEISKFIYENGVLTPKRYMPSMNEEYAWSFIAGYFDGYGELTFKHNNPRVFIQSPVTDVITFIAKHWQVRNNYSDKVIANGYKALDICGSMYANVSPNQHKWGLFLEILNTVPNKILAGKNQNFEYMKLHPNAVEPDKTYVTDSGYDLYILELNKLYTTPWGAQVYHGKTELAIKPIFGYSFDINGRSSLPKSGWQFLQGTGICDRSYIGGIQATFMKLNDEPLPKMPWKALQIVPREAPIHAKFISSKDLGESFRGAGGFGSTGS